MRSAALPHCAPVPPGAGPGRSRQVTGGSAGCASSSPGRPARSGAGSCPAPSQPALCASGQALSPRRGDFSDDLQAFGLGEPRAAPRPQCAAQGASGFDDGTCPQVTVAIGEEPAPNRLCQHRKVRRLWFCARCREHGVDLTPMVGLVVEELNNTECFRLLDPS